MRCVICATHEAEPPRPVQTSLRYAQDIIGIYMYMDSVERRLTRLCLIPGAITNCIVYLVSLVGFRDQFLQTDNKRREYMLEKRNFNVFNF